MKRALPFVPFVLLAGLSLATRWVNNGHWLGNTWGVTFLACLLCVPVLSRRKLWLGYAALFYPFVVLNLQVAFDWGNLNIGFN